MDTVARELLREREGVLSTRYAGELGHKASQLTELAEYGQELQELHIEPTQPEYAQLPIADAFDWQDLLDQAKGVRGIDAATTPIYLVVFRSTLKPDADRELLAKHDAMAHIAAQASPALLHYFGGTPDETGRSLSFCIWSDREEARSVSKDASHVDAMSMVRMYESYGLEKYFVSGQDGEIIFDAVR